jgi:hypothetical protein
MSGQQRPRRLESWHTAMVQLTCVLLLLEDVEVLNSMVVAIDLLYVAGAELLGQVLEGCLCYMCWVSTINSKGDQGVSAEAAAGALAHGSHSRPALHLSVLLPVLAAVSSVSTLLLVMPACFA